MDCMDILGSVHTMQEKIWKCILGWNLLFISRSKNTSDQVVFHTDLVLLEVI